MYKYSKKSQERFMSYPIFSYLLVFFASSKEGLSFLRQKYSEKGLEYIQRMREELDDLKREAMKTIERYLGSKNDQNIRMLLNSFN